MIDQKELHSQCLSDDPFERIKGLERLINNYVLLSDKQQAWNDLIKLAGDKNFDIKLRAISAIDSSFCNVPNKQKAWEDLTEIITNYENSSEIYNLIFVLKSAYPQVPDKQKAWNDLIKLITDGDSPTRLGVARSLGFAFPYVPDRQQAWNDLITLIDDKDWYVRNGIADALLSAFSYVPDKQKAWNELVIINSENEYSNVTYKIASALVSAFSRVPDKQKAWNELIKLTNRETDSEVRFRAASTLIYTFFEVPDKQKAWNDLIKLTNDKDWDVKHFVVSALDYMFSYVPDKQQAWNDLHKLVMNEDSWIRAMTVIAVGSVFSYIPDKQQAWDDLHSLTTDGDKLVRSRAASALGLAFSYLPDKQQVFSDLFRLINDQNGIVRSCANHSLGKICIFKASQAEKEEVYKEELENAIEFFEIATNESPDEQSNSSQFCLPFYRSFYNIIFKRLEAKEEIDKYLTQTKAAVKGSKSREMLFEAAQNLANALKEIKNLETVDLDSKKKELNFYRKYCEKATELMNDTEEVSPFATEVLRKGLPIFDRKLKSLLEEIREKAKTACQESKGTITEEIACAVSREVQKWEIGTQEEMSCNVDNLIFTLKSSIPRIPENQYIFDKIQQIREQKDIAKQYSIISLLISSIPIVKIERLKKTEDNSANFSESKGPKEGLPEACDYLTVDAGLNTQIDMLKEHYGFIREDKRAHFFKMLEEAKKMDVKKKLENIPKIYEYVANNRIFPFIEKISISHRINEIVKIAAVQLCYKLSEEFPYQVKTEHKEVIKQKIRNVLNIAHDEKVDILCLPELCISEDLIPEIRNSCHEMIVVAGTYYDNSNHNLCKIVMSSDMEVPPQLKITPSDFEKSDYIEQKMVPGKKILNLYETKFGKFAVLICRDFGNFVSTLKGKVDLIFVPSYNSANKRFHEYARLHVEDSPSYVIISNTAQYGGTAIFGRIRDTFYSSLELKGYKQKGDKTFKLCEINKGEEGMIIADFNLLYKSFLIPAPIDPDEDIIPVENIKIISI